MSQSVKKQRLLLPTHEDEKGGGQPKTKEQELVNNVSNDSHLGVQGSPTPDGTRTDQIMFASDI